MSTWLMVWATVAIGLFSVIGLSNVLDDEAARVSESRRWAMLVILAFIGVPLWWLVVWAWSAR